PSIWHDDWPNWMRAMSLMGGSSIHPESVVALRRSTGAPQFGQLADEASLTKRHQGHVYSSAIRLLPGCPCSIGVVMDIHRLDADPPRTGHAGQVHAPSPEHVRLHVLLLDAYG